MRRMLRPAFRASRRRACRGWKRDRSPFGRTCLGYRTGNCDCRGYLGVDWLAELAITSPARPIDPLHDGKCNGSYGRRGDVATNRADAYARAPGMKSAITQAGISSSIRLEQFRVVARPSQPL